ncbi:MAG TPA: glycoside hydrolase family 95 protein [Steroidobacteraceae bacterium]|nr:glycoside hydrolase family 95 protein [Steroidobacteraceae bacterium]
MSKNGRSPTVTHAGGVTRRAALQGGLALGAVAGGAGSLSAADNPPSPDALKLWYQQAAAEWTEALPIGNGRIGAMVFGGVARERLQLNDDTLYAGGPYDPTNPDALYVLPRVRSLIAEGKYREAQALANERMMAQPLRMPSYQTVGDLMLNFTSSSFVTDYRRELDLDAALASTRYRRDDVLYTREVFASPVDDVIVMRIGASRLGSVSFRASFETPMPATARAAGDTLVLSGANTSQQGLAAKLRFEARVRIVTSGGTIVPRDEEIEVVGADSALLVIAIATSYRNYHDVDGDPAVLTRARLAAVAARSWDALYAAHVAQHRRLFRRVALDLGHGGGDKPTDARIRESQSGEDPQLAVLYVQYARYLLISCSRPGGQPANLQGLWNDKVSAPWGSKYTININTEMNYWPAEGANLAECVTPLVDMVRELAVTGARTARVNYGAKGWVAHHNTDGWRATAPIDGARWGLWPTGGAWLCKHLWDHYDYGRDPAYLESIYPLMKGAAEFFLDTLWEEPRTGHLVTCPSLSPENEHPFGAALCAGPAMDSQILRDLFDHCVRAAEILQRDPEFILQCVAARGRLPPDQIGKAGQLQEWLEDWDLEAPEPNHRHVSHLYALYPSGQISVRRTPELAAAARHSLELRGDLSTGWAIAWRLNLWARLRDAEHAYTVLKLLLDPSRTYPNLFDAHPPFQIDGNFGGASGILEMLLQCVDGEIELLPALPKAWPAGSVRGLRARGGFEVDLAWREGRLTVARLRGAPGGTARVRYGESARDVHVPRGRSVVLRV